MCTATEKQTYAALAKASLLACKTALATLLNCESSGCQGHGGQQYSDDMQAAADLAKEISQSLVTLGFESAEAPPESP